MIKPEEAATVKNKTRDKLEGKADKAKGRIVGSDQFLTKPFSKEELLNAIQAHVPGFAAVLPQ